MGSALVRSSLKSVWLEFNGDRDDRLAEQLKNLDRLEGKVDKLERELDSTPTKEKINEIKRVHRKIEKVKGEAQDNAIVCRLSYPRSGSSSVESMKRVRLPSGRVGDRPPIQNKSPIFLEHGLFKEEIQGEAMLQVAVTDTDPRNAFLAFFRRVLSTAFSAATRGLISDISGVVTNSVATVLSKDISESLGGGGKKQVQIVAVSETAKLKIDSKGKIALENPSPGIELKDGELKMALKTPQYLQTARNKYLRRGAGNGEIAITLEAEAI